MVVKARLSKQVHHAAACARLGVGGAEHHACYAGVHERPHAHDTRLQSDVERGPWQAIVAEALRCLAQRLNLCVRRWVMCRDRAIVALPHCLAVQHQHRADRHFTQLGGPGGEPQRHLHVTLVRSNVRCIDGYRRLLDHSHSIVAGGLPEMSYTTRLMPRTSLMMRVETFDSNACGSSAQCAVMKSSV